MRTLYHYPLCVFSRIVRFSLAEKKLDCSYEYQAPWDVSDEVFKYNIAGTLPVFIDINGTSVFGNSAIREYINEMYPEPDLLGKDSAERAEVRKIADWFCFLFYNDVYSHIFDEKITKRFSKYGDRVPNPARLRSAITKLGMHMDYVSWLIDRRNWLGGKHFSMADIYAASFISVIDYLGSVQWQKHDGAKVWYARIKSRPSFRNILGDVLSQMAPSNDYSNPDF
jgi:glutathione S-transferase